jgi:hypothetical protein
MMKRHQAALDIGAGPNLLAQRGGITSNYRVIPEQYALVQRGEGYLMFLTADKRPNTPDVIGLKRYLITGIWSVWVIRTRSENRISSLDCLRGSISGYDVK